MTKFVKWVPIWAFMPFVLIMTLYPPIELSRVIYITAFNGVHISKAGHASWEFILEIIFMWTFMALGWWLIYLRAKK